MLKRWCVLAVVVCLISIGSSQTCMGTQWQSRADDAVSSFLKNFWNGGARYLNLNYPADSKLSEYWNYAVSFDAVVSGAQFLRSSNYRNYIADFYTGQNSRGWNRDFYDDLNWMCMALLNAHDVTSNNTYLSRAESIFQGIMGAWDTSCCGSTKGGIWWDTRHTQKATASNGGPVITAVLLYQATRNNDYLNFAKKVYDFWKANMVNSNGQVADHMNAPSGEKVWWSFTYNQGLMIGAATKLYEVTQDRQYLNDATLVADFMSKSQVTNNQVLTDNCGGGTDCPQFKGIGYKYLALLYKNYESSNTLYRTVLVNSATSLWNNARDSQGLFAVHWAGPPPSLPVNDAQDSAAVMALLYSCLIQ